MQNLTLAVGIIGATLVVFLSPVLAFATYISVLLLYPTYLTVNIGSINITASRILVAALMLKCVLDKDLKRSFRWSALDTWVTLSMGVYVGIMLVTYPISEALQNRAGYLMDTWFAYLVARFCITNQHQLRTAIKWIAIVLTVLAILGLVESFSGWQPYLPLTRYCPWRPELRLAEPRSGLNRAIGPFGHPIMFGMAFALFLPLVYSLRCERRWRGAAFFLSIMIILGALSSMSSGPIMMVIAAILCLVMENFKRWVKPLLYLSVIMCVMVGIVSNRPFYHVMLSYLNPIGGSWWHRAKLIDLAIEHFGEWWLIGYGGKDPGWGDYLGSNHTDVTNEFILAGVQYGILGVIALCSVLVVVFSNLIRMHNSATEHQVKSLAWALGSSIFATIVVFMSVSFFGQILTLFYCILGIVGSVGCFPSRRPPTGEAASLTNDLQYRLGLPLSP
jgi:hypothetical protein